MQQKLMTFREWLDFEVPISEMIVACVPESIMPTPSIMDSQKLPIGMCRILLPYLHEIADIPEDINSQTCLNGFNTASGNSIYQKQGLKASPRYFFRQNLEANGFPNRYKKLINCKSCGSKSAERKRSYIKDTFDHKFTASPTGIWKEAYRTYEAFYCKSIPILINDDFLKQKYEGLPTLWTWDYSECTEDYLLAEYEKILDMTFDFGKLLISHFSALQQEVIQKRMLFRTNPQQWAEIYANGSMPSIESFMN